MLAGFQPHSAIVLGVLSAIRPFRGNFRIAGPLGLENQLLGADLLGTDLRRCPCACDEGSATVCGDGQALFGSRGLKIFADGPEFCFCCAGEVEALRFVLVSRQETT